MIIPLFFLCFDKLFAQTEINLPNHEEKRYYFGITLSGNSATFSVDHHPKFLQTDTITLIRPSAGPGFGLGLVGTLRLLPHLEARINPGLMFATRNINYNNKYPLPGDSLWQAKKVESIYVNLPIQLKFSSDRITNFRVYVIGGLVYNYDLASNSKARRAEGLMKINKSAFGYEGGLGFHFYFPSFIFSPEIKISNTFGSVHNRDAGLIYSNVIDRMQARMIVFAIHLEG
jgi:hypothetical protein